MGRLEFLLLELLSKTTCVNAYASAGRTHGSICTKTNLSKAFCVSYGNPSNISEPFFQHVLDFLITTTILWTIILCPFQRCLTVFCWRSSKSSRNLWVFTLKPFQGPSDLMASVPLTRPSVRIDPLGASKNIRLGRTYCKRMFLQDRLFNVGIRSGKTDPVQFKGLFKKDPFCL